MIYFVHGFRGFSPWFLGPYAWVEHDGGGRGYPLQGGQEA
jgi:hypothetical protein